jgi:hypothetical protein
MSIQASQEIIAISMLVLTFLILLITVGLLVALFMAISTLRKTNKRLEPTIAKAQGAMGTIDLMVKNIQPRAESVAASADHVAARVRNTTDVVTESLARPAITVAGLIAGVSKALEVYGKLRKKRGGVRRAA